MAQDHHNQQPDADTALATPPSGIPYHNLASAGQDNTVWYTFRESGPQVLAYQPQTSDFSAVSLEIGAARQDLGPGLNYYTVSAGDTIQVTGRGGNIPAFQLNFWAGFENVAG